MSPRLQGLELKPFLEFRRDLCVSDLPCKRIRAPTGSARVRRTLLESLGPPLTTWQEPTYL